MHGERTLYYVVEHPTRGMLRDLEQTDSGAIGRFASAANRADERIARFTTPKAAWAAIDRQTRVPPGTCVVRCSQWQRDGYNDAWPTISREAASAIQATVAYVNVTNANGVLLGRFPLTRDDLNARALADQSIGERVRESFPRTSLNNDGAVVRPDLA